MFTDTNKDILVIIPARYDSSRLPGKPLIKIKGTEMIKRVANIASRLCATDDDCAYVVATDDERIMRFCDENGINAAMTSRDCRNGTERCADLLRRLNLEPKLVVNLQGDNPLCPPEAIGELIAEWRKTEADVYTLCVALTWEELDKLKALKRETPFSGTTVVADKNGFAMAFSKNIIPAVRKPEKAREILELSPVMRHIGLYAYSRSTLMNYAELTESPYEKDFTEGLEQMRFLYNGLKIKLTLSQFFKGLENATGVDSPEDVERYNNTIVIQ